MTGRKNTCIAVASYYLWESCLARRRWGLNKWVLSLESWAVWGRWRVTLLSWHWLGVCSITEAPEHRRVATLLSELFFAFSGGSTSWSADVVELSACDLGCGLTSVSRQVQFGWCPWRSATSSLIVCGPQQEANGGHRGWGSHGRIWVDQKWGTLQRLSRSQQRIAVVQAGDEHRLDRALRKDWIVQMLLRANLQDHATVVDDYAKVPHSWWRRYHDVLDSDWQVHARVVSTQD